MYFLISSAEHVSAKEQLFERDRGVSSCRLAAVSVSRSEKEVVLLGCFAGRGKEAMVLLVSWKIASSPSRNQLQTPTIMHSSFSF